MLQEAVTVRRPMPTSAPGVRDYDQIRRAIAFLARTWTEQPGLEELAVHLDLEPTQCQKLFKRWCGLSPKEFVQALTVHHARGLLKDSASVLDAAFEVGLSGGGRLHDLFVSHEAMTPGEYKRRGEGLEMAYGFHASPFGEALLIATRRGLAGLAFVDEDKGQTPQDTLAEMMLRWPRAQFVAAPDRTASFARLVFNPADWSKDRPVRLVMFGSDFEVRVWETLLRIPMGR
ncbi:MAG TPA: helix-turn-helix domain-containing protein, partial [Hyphomicrobiaceae bacterium]|nr:helix-turn-helix domain-containing protein [Hyphomicrobiaceae bacterium]